MKHIGTSLTHWFTADHVSLVISVLAFAAAFWAASATARQARIAREQLEESIKASNNAVVAAKESKAVTWHDIVGRLMERKAKVVIGVEKIKWPPILLSEIPIGDEYPKSAKPDQPKTVNSKSFRERSSYIYFWVRGAIINEDSRSIQFIPFGMDLIEGKTSLVTGEIKVPPKMHPDEGRYLLAPGKAALFESRIQLTVQQWIEIYREPLKAQKPHMVVFSYPAGDPEASSAIRIEFDGCPLEEKLNDDGIWDGVWEIEDYIPECVKVRSPNPVPSQALRQFVLNMGGGSGQAYDKKITWDLEPWERHFLDVW